MGTGAQGAGLARARFVFHSLRHFCASTLLAEGAPPPAVSGHLGDTVEIGQPDLCPLAARRHREVPAAVLDRVLAPAPMASDSDQQPDGLSTR